VYKTFTVENSSQKLVFSEIFEKMPEVKKIAQSGHPVYEAKS
jgi:hypothetical protein